MLKTVIHILIYKIIQIKFEKPIFEFIKSFQKICFPQVFLLKSSISGTHYILYIKWLFNIYNKVYIG